MPFFCSLYVQIALKDEHTQYAVRNRRMQNTIEVERVRERMRKILAKLDKAALAPNNIQQSITTGVTNLFVRLHFGSCLINHTKAVHVCVCACVCMPFMDPRHHGSCCNFS